MSNINKNFINLDYREFTLNNGLKVVMSVNKKIPVLTVNSTFHIGSKDEDENKTGLAHLFEHLMFEGSENVEKGNFDEILNSNGGDSNAYTSWDITSYHISIPSNKLELALWLDSGRIAGFRIDNESLEIQKKVVMEEKLQVHDNTPYGSVEAESSKRLFKNSGYKSPIIGNMEHLEKVDLIDINNFFNMYYVPCNMVLSVVGDIKFDETEKMIKKYYENIPPGKYIERKLYDESEILAEICETIFDDINLPGKFYFYRIPKSGTREYYISHLISAMLTEGDSSRLYRELVYDKQLLNEVDSAIYGMEDVSLFNINSIAMEGADINEIENRIDDELNNIKEGKFTEDEIFKVKNRIITKYITKLQTNNNLADKFSEIRTFYPDCSKINKEINEYDDITKSEITDFASEFLDKKKRVVLNYLPRE